LNEVPRFQRIVEENCVRTLVVSSTLFEIAALIERETGRRVEGMGTAGTLINGTWCDFLVSGVGPVACGVHVTRVLATGRYDQIIQAGIGGSFVADLPVGSVVVVSEEAFGDLGAESNGSFLDLFEMNLLSKDQAPFIDRLLMAPTWELSALDGLPRVRAVTLSRVLSEPQSISWITERYSPQVANMEGAALFYAALLHGVRFLSMRAISDMVGPRDRGAWKIAEAVSALDQALQGTMGELSRGTSSSP
jgi:futalosine hydrolase